MSPKPTSTLTPKPSLSLRPKASLSPTPRPTLSAKQSLTPNPSSKLTSQQSSSASRSPVSASQPVDLFTPFSCSQSIYGDVGPLATDLFSDNHGVGFLPRGIIYRSSLLLYLLWS
jgi:hypothetical protein